MIIRDDPCFDQLACDLRLLSELGKLVYVANPGNWGDALIAHGTRQFFKDHDLNVTEISLYKACSLSASRLRWVVRARNPILVFGGGGAFLDHYKRKAQVESIFKKFYRSLIMPSTFAVRLDTSLAKRDPITYRRDECESVEFAPKSRFCHDLAFYLKAPEIDSSSKEGFLFREDTESPEGILLPKCNRDVSSEGSASSDINGFFSVVGTFETIYTNRLHVAIAGCLLGREVHLFPNSYFKNEAIFKSSIKPFFSNVNFHRDTPEAYGLSP